MATPPRDPTPKQKVKGSAIIPPPISGAAATRRQREGRRRLEKITWFYLAQTEHGLSRRAAARYIRVPYLSLWKWEARIRNGGFAGLVSRRKGPELSPGIQAGLQPHIIRRVQWLSVVKGSVAGGWRAFASDSLCPPTLREMLKRDIPDVLREAIGLRTRKMTVRVRVVVRKAGSFMRRVELRRKAA